MDMYTAKKKLGELIRSLRSQRKVCAKGLAKMIGTKKDNVLNIEAGSAVFTREMVNTIIMVLGAVSPIAKEVLDRIEKYLNAINPKRLGPVFRQSVA